MWPNWITADCKPICRILCGCEVLSCEASKKCLPTVWSPPSTSTGHLPAGKGANRSAITHSRTPQQLTPATGLTDLKLNDCCSQLSCMESLFQKGCVHHREECLFASSAAQRTKLFRKTLFLLVVTALFWNIASNKPPGRAETIWTDLYVAASARKRDWAQDLQLDRPPGIMKGYLQLSQFCRYLWAHGNQNRKNNGRGFLYVQVGYEAQTPILCSSPDDVFYQPTLSVWYLSIPHHISPVTSRTKKWHIKEEL